MAVELDGKTSGEYIQITDPAQNWDGSTVCWWCWMDALADADQAFFRQSATASNYFAQQAFGQNSRMQTNYPRVTTLAGATTTDGFLVQGQWLFIASTYTSGGSGPKIFKGTLTGAVAEASYQSQSDGAGAVRATDDDFFVCATAAAAAFSMNGRLAMFRFITRDLSLAELESLRLDPYRRDPDDLFLLIPGIYGSLTNVYDLSGNGNNGTGSSLALADNLPIWLDVVPRRSMLAELASAIEVEGYRWRDDDGSESAATWLAAQDTDITRPNLTTTRLRTLINSTGTNPSAQDELQYALDGTSDWRKIGP